MESKNKVIEFIEENARRLGVPPVTRTDDLFRDGVLDSFTLVDLITLIEQEYGIKIPDDDVHPTNFRSLEVIEKYIDDRGPSE